MSAECEFARDFDLAGLAGNEATVEVVAERQERTALASRFRIESVEALSARLMISRGADGTVRVRGKLSAGIVQRCVVSLEPFSAAIEERFQRVYGPLDRTGAGEVTIEVEGGDLVEPLAGDRLNLGEVVAEQLGLSIDPYPRKDEVEFSWRDPNRGDAESDGGKSPFAALNALKPEQGPR